MNALRQRSPATPEVAHFNPAFSARPTIADLVPGYVGVGISKRDAVRYILDSRFAATIGRGHGNKAARREGLIEMYREDDGHCLTEADVDRLAEYFAENVPNHFNP